MRRSFTGSNGWTSSHNSSETIHGATAIGTPLSLTTDAHGVRRQRAGPFITKGALRRGDWIRAEALALQASRRIADVNPLRVRAFVLAGASAHLNNRDQQAMEYYSQAYDSAENESDRWEAARGKVASAIVLESPDASQLLDALAALNDGSAERELDFASVRHNFNHRLGTAVGASR